jgi:hypothetical protein
VIWHHTKWRVLGEANLLIIFAKLIAAGTEYAHFLENLLLLSILGPR